MAWKLLENKKTADVFIKNGDFYLQALMKKCVSFNQYWL